MYFSGRLPTRDYADYMERAVDSICKPLDGFVKVISALQDLSLSRRSKITLQPFSEEDRAASVFVFGFVDDEVSELA
jgi:hypothetical protein